MSQKPKFQSQIIGKSKRHDKDGRTIQNQKVSLNLSRYQMFFGIEQIEAFKQSKTQADCWRLSNCYMQNLYWQKSKVRNLKNSKWSVYWTSMAWGIIGSVIILIRCRNLTIHVFLLKLSTGASPLTTGSTAVAATSTLGSKCRPAARTLQRQRRA